MPLVQILVILILVGVGLYFVNTLIPMAASIKNIINVVIPLLVVLWLLGLFFDFGSLNTIRIGK